MPNTDSSKARSPFSVSEKRTSPKRFLRSSIKPKSFSSRIGHKRVRPFCICSYCICCAARVDLRRGFHRHGCVTAHASRNFAHDSEGERKRGLVTVVHRVNYTIFAALRVGFRGRFPWPRKVSVVRREQIRVLIKTAAQTAARVLQTLGNWSGLNLTSAPCECRANSCHYMKRTLALDMHPRHSSVA